MINQIQVATVTGLPDGQHLGTVKMNDADLTCYFDPLRFVAPAPVPTIGARVWVMAGVTALQALYMVGQEMTV